VFRCVFPPLVLVCSSTPSPLGPSITLSRKVVEFGLWFAGDTAHYVGMSSGAETPISRAPCPQELPQKELVPSSSGKSLPMGICLFAPVLCEGKGRIRFADDGCCWVHALDPCKES
jgi:hypothetical protein